MIFDRAYQLKQPLYQPYESPNGFDHVNRVCYCNHCKTDTRQAVYEHTEDYTNTSGTVRMVTVSEYRDCLSCENTTYERVSQEKYHMNGGAA